MARELNPDLFGSSVPKAEKSHSLENPDPYRKKIRDLEIHVHSLTQKIEKLTLLIEKKSIQSQHSTKSLETQVRGAISELAKRQSILGQKLTEKKAVELKLQEIMDRHNQVVHNFEVKMNQMQKLCTEQEVKLMSYKSTMDSLLKEIRAFKS